MWRFARALSCAAVAAMLGFTALPASAGSVAVFSEDFDGTSSMPSKIHGVGRVEKVRGFTGVGDAGDQFSGNFLRNNAGRAKPARTSVMLTNLPEHSSVDVDFLLAL